MARAGFGNGGARASGGRSLGELVGEATGEVSLLFRKELELAKLEVKDALRVAADAGKFFGVAGLTAFLAMLLLSFAAA